METFLYIIFFISCIVLIGTVLLQPGKTDAGALFTSGVSNTSTNPRGTASVLAKATITASVVFMLSALMLSLPAITGDRSVLSTQGAPDTSSSSNADNTNSANSSASESNTASNSATETKVEEKKDEGAKTEEKSEEKKDESSDDKKPAEEKPEETDDKKPEDK